MGKEEREFDPNVEAYNASEQELKEKYMGKWVAFVDGKLAVTEDDEDSLFLKLNTEFPRQGAFIKHIVEVERVIHFRSPRRIRKI